MNGPPFPSHHLHSLLNTHVLFSRWLHSFRRPPVERSFLGTKSRISLRSFSVLQNVLKSESLLRQLFCKICLPYKPFLHPQSWNQNLITPRLRRFSNLKGMPQDAARAFAVIQTDSHESRKYFISDKVVDNSLEAALRSTVSPRKLNL